MSSMKVVAALLVVAACFSSIRAIDPSEVTPVGCETAVLNFDGTDYYGNDISSANQANAQACFQACVDDTACVALVYKTVSTLCYLKNAVNTTTVKIPGTGFSADLTPCKNMTGTDTSPSPSTTAGTVSGSSMNTTDGWTFQSIATLANGKFVTTNVTSVAGAKATTVTYYSDALGAPVTDAPALTPTTVTITPDDGTYPTQAVISVMTETGEMITTNVVNNAGTLDVSGTVDASMAPPAPPALTGTDIAFDAATGILSMNSTVPVENSQYVTVQSKLDNTTGMDAGTRAFFSDMLGAPIGADLSGAMTMPGGAAYPGAEIVSIVPVPGQGNVTVVGMKGADGNYMTTSKFLPVTPAASPPPPTTSVPVIVSSPPPKASSAFGFSLLGALASVAAFGALML